MQNAKTNKRKFLEKFDSLIPWEDWVSIIEPIPPTTDEFGDEIPGQIHEAVTKGQYCQIDKNDIKFMTAKEAAKYLIKNQMKTKIWCQKKPIHPKVFSITKMWYNRETKNT